jgi:hypothetical protein
VLPRPMLRLTLLHVLFLLPVRGEPAPLFIGLFSPSTPAALRSAQLAGAAAALGLPPPSSALQLEVPPPQPLSQLLADDHFSVSARAAMLAGERRSHSDVATPAAAALALAHAAAWEALLASPAAAACVVVDPGSALAPPPSSSSSSSSPPLPDALQRGVAAMWGAAAPPADLLLLGALVPPAASREPPEAALAAAGWRVPLRWRGWHAYVLTRRGATALLAEGAAPISQRAEAHASALADLGLLRALWLPSAPAAPARAPRWAASEGAAATSSLGALLAEQRCDLCDVPEDYSRFGHIFAAGAPAALLAGLLCGWVAFRCLGPRRSAAALPINSAVC